MVFTIPIFPRAPVKVQVEVSARDAMFVALDPDPALDHFLHPIPFPGVD